jgi:hypothetical protein
MNNDQKTQDLQDQILRLKSEVADLAASFYKNNFSSRQEFNKTCNFSVALKVPLFTSLPVGEVGNICGLTTGGTTKLYICTTGGDPSTWTLVGTQS